MLYVQLFWAFLQIGALSFGGGYAAVPLLQGQIVETYHWLTPGQFADIVSISQMTPGPISINAATFVGIQVAGLPGALIATLGCVLPSCGIVLALAVLYRRYRERPLFQGTLRGVRPAVVGMIAAAALSLIWLALTDAAPWWGVGGLDIGSLALFAICFLLLRRVKWGPTTVMLAAGAVGLVIGIAEQVKGS